jgi:L-iditol 2-dehydrogenase
MLVARIHGANDIRMHDEPMPTPKAGELLVKVTSVGVCGSDVHWYHEGRIGQDCIKKPIALGHEGAGIIASGPRKGEHVAIDPAITCGHCENCELGNPNLCTAMAFAGHAPQDGMFSEYIAWPERCLFTLPQGISDEDGAMLEPLGVGMYAVDLGEVKPGMTVGIFGCGPIGVSLIQLAKAAGAAKIWATDFANLPHRLKAAEAAGAVPVPVDGGKEAAFIYKASGHGVDVSFEAAGAPEAVEATAPEAVEATIQAVKAGGRAVIVGIPSEDKFCFTASAARSKDLLIRIAHRMKHTYPRSMALVSSGRADGRSLISHRFPLKEAKEAFASAMRREGLKVVIEC